MRSASVSKGVSKALQSYEYLPRIVTKGHEFLKPHFWDTDFGGLKLKVGRLKIAAIQIAAIQIQSRSLP
jgi:hypothetical protein